MPEFTTHYLFGQSILEGFSPEIKSIIENNMTAFKWGLQGPDLLFYSTIVYSSFGSSSPSSVSSGVILLLRTE